MKYIIYLSTLLCLCMPMTNLPMSNLPMSNPITYLGNAIYHIFVQSPLPPQSTTGVIRVPRNAPTVDANDLTLTSSKKNIALALRAEIIGHNGPYFLIKSQNRELTLYETPLQFACKYPLEDLVIELLQTYAIDPNESYEWAPGSPLRTLLAARKLIPLDLKGLVTPLFGEINPWLPCLLELLKRGLVRAYDLNKLIKEETALDFVVLDNQRTAFDEEFGDFYFSIEPLDYAEPLAHHGGIASKNTVANLLDMAKQKQHTINTTGANYTSQQKIKRIESLVRVIMENSLDRSVFLNCIPEKNPLAAQTGIIAKKQDNITIVFEPSKMG